MIEMIREKTVITNVMKQTIGLKEVAGVALLFSKDL